ncbi:MAG: thrombospondin type 3 repeat-containing protein [bacterium]
MRKKRRHKSPALFISIFSILIFFSIILSPLLLRVSQAQEPYSLPALEDNNPSDPNYYDNDGDWVEDSHDNCISFFNPDQMDGDGDGIGDVCDTCIMVYNPDQSDDDWDGVGNACDNCPHRFNPVQGDFDADKVGDTCDNCLLKPNGDQRDENQNGIGDACDQYFDTDGDAICDAEDNCPDVFNPGQLDWDSDNVGDACDSPPALFCPDSITVEAVQPEGVPASQQEAPGGGEVGLFLSSARVFGMPGTILSSDAPSLFGIGTTTVTFTAQDPKGGSTTCQSQVVVQDTIPPHLILPDDLTVEQDLPDGTKATNPRIAAFLAGAVAFDLADSHVPVSTTQPLPQVFPLGETPLTFVATDRSGNTAQGQAIITVKPSVLTLTITSDTTLSAEDMTYDRHNLIVNGCELIIQGGHALNSMFLYHRAKVSYSPQKSITGRARKTSGALEVAGDITLQAGSSLSIQEGSAVSSKSITLEGQSTLFIQDGAAVQTGALSVSQDSIISPQSLKNITLSPLLPAFTVDPEAGQAPLKVQFTDQSSDQVTSWLWDFGDGESSTSQNPVHTYTRAGIFTVTLTIDGPKRGLDGKESALAAGESDWTTREVSTIPLSASTTWSGEKNISGNTVIPEGKSLLIQPGSVVRFLGDFSLTVLGTLYAIGRPDQRILFTSSGQGGWKGLTIASSETSIQYCTFEKVLGEGQAALTVQNASPFVANNRFSQNSTGLLLRNSGGEYLRNTLTGNTVAAICVENPSHVDFLSLRQNLIAKNEIGIKIKQTDQNISLIENSFQAQTAYHLQNLSSENISATDNWWDTGPRRVTAQSQDDMSTASLIAHLIYDRLDDGRYGQVDYEPYRPAPHSAAPVPFVCGLHFLPATNGTILNWEPHPAQDIKGYRIYVLDAGNIGTDEITQESPFIMIHPTMMGATSADLGALSPDDRYAVTVCDREGDESLYSIVPQTPSGFSVLSDDRGGIQVIFESARQSDLLGHWLYYGTWQDVIETVLDSASGTYSTTALNAMACQKVLILKNSAPSITLTDDVTWYLSLTACDRAENQSIPTAVLNFTHAPTGLLTFQKPLETGITQDRYQMISVPLKTMTREQAMNKEQNPDDEQSLTNEIEPLFQDELGAYDPRYWRLFRYDPVREKYLEFPDTSTLSPGESVWIISREGKTVTFFGYAVSADKNYPIPLKPGWNQIANPFHFPVSWKDVYRLNTAIVKEDQLYRYDRRAPSHYVRASELVPGEGYWVQNILKKKADLLIPPISQKLPDERLKVSASAAQAASSASASPSPLQASGASLALQADDPQDMPPPPPQAFSQNTLQDDWDSAPKSCFLSACAAHVVQENPTPGNRFWGQEVPIPEGISICLGLAAVALLPLMLACLSFLPALVSFMPHPSPLLFRPSSFLILCLCLCLHLFCSTPLAASREYESIRQGIQRYRDQQYDEAASLFKEAIQSDPTEARAHLYLGLTYYQKNMLDEAREELQKAATLSQDPRIDEVANKYQDLISRKKKIFFLSLLVSLQYDDNVLMTPYTSEAEATGNTDWKNVFTLSSRVRPWRKEHTFLLLGYDFYQSLYHELKVYNIRGHIGSFTLEHKKGPLRVEFKSAFNRFLLDDRPYLEMEEVSLLLSLDRKKTRQREFPFGYQWKTYPIADDVPSLNGRDAKRVAIGVREVFFSKDRRQRFRLGYAYSREDVDTDYFSFQEHELSADFRTPFLYHSELNLSGAYTIRDYLHPDPAYGGREREDNKRTISTTWLKKLGAGYSLTVQYSRIVNHSNLNRPELDRQYRRNLYTLGILKQF